MELFNATNLQLDSIREALSFNSPERHVGDSMLLKVRLISYSKDPLPDLTQLLYISHVA